MEISSSKTGFSCDKCHLIPFILSINHSLEEGNSLKYICSKKHLNTKLLRNYIKENQENLSNYFCSVCNNKILQQTIYYNNILNSIYCQECNDKKEKSINTTLVENIDDLNFTCFLHNQIFDGYCLDCLTNKCDSCKEHIGHHIFDFKEKANKLISKIKTSLNDSEIFIEKIVNFKEKKLNKNSIYISNKKIDDIEKLYNNFINMNKEQILFIKNCLNYLEKQKDKLNLEIIENIKTCFQFNFIKIINFEKDITHDLINLFISILKTYSVIRKAELKIKLELTDKDKNQISINKNIQNFSTIPKKLKKKNLYNNVNFNKFSSQQFCVFKSLTNQDILVFPNSNEIIIYNLNFFQKMSNFKIFKKEIRCIRYYRDYKKKKDLILVCGLDNKIILFDFFSLKILTCINNVSDKDCYVISVSMIFDINDNYFISSSLFDKYLKIWNSKGESIDVINEEEKINFMDTFFDKKLAKYFIVIGTTCGSKTFDFEKRSLYLQYSFVQSYSLVCTEYLGESVLIESDYRANVVLIYDFHKGDILKEYKTANFEDYYYGLGICLWNSNFILQCSFNYDNCLLGINIKDNKIVKYGNLNNQYFSCQKINIKNLGYSLIAIANNGDIDLITIDE